jgi:GDPmannose 4,6-dehydratase
VARRALIVGIGGQDGAYLARHLLARGYAVDGTSRGEGVPANLDRLGVGGEVTMHRFAIGDGAGTLLKAALPDEIYWLAAQSSVGASFAHPAEGLEAAIGLTGMLAAAREIVPAARLLFAASGECFGETTPEAPAREDSAFSPRSPYAVGKCAGHHAIACARAAYRQFACSAFLFTHESPLRPESFVIGKIAATVRRIATGSQEVLRLGDCSVVRDWGWAPDYVDAMHRMLQQDDPRDFIIATGRSTSLEALVAESFALIGRDWRGHVELAAVPRRPGEARTHHADPSRALAVLGWQAQADAREVLRRLILDPAAAG